MCYKIADSEGSEKARQPAGIRLKSPYSLTGNILGPKAIEMQAIMQKNCVNPEKPAAMCVQAFGANPGMAFATNAGKSFFERRYLPQGLDDRRHGSKRVINILFCRVLGQGISDGTVRKHEGYVHCPQDM